jgi:hypothetical protein
MTITQQAVGEALMNSWECDPKGCIGFRINNAPADLINYSRQCLRRSINATSDAMTQEVFFNHDSQ